MYSPDEYAFINALIEKRDLKDSYIKAQTITNIFDLLWKIYLDFYAHLNPKMEVFIEKKQKLWKEKRESKHVIYVIKNMFISKSSRVVFEARKYVFDGGITTHIYPKGKGVYHNLTMAIKKGHMKNAAYILSKNIGCGHAAEGTSGGACSTANACSKVLFDIIIDYFEKKYGGADRANIDEKWKNRPTMTGCSDEHYLLALIAHLSANENEINNSMMIVVPKNEECVYKMQ
jgi:hypothetical protein